MCGLCGVLSSTISTNEFEKFKDLLMVSSFRGTHSTGVFSVQGVDKGKKRKYNGAILKQPISAGHFLGVNEKTLNDRIHTSDTIFVAGHCRHATKGVINSANAHPFDLPNLIGMHNGTLSDNIGPKISRTIGHKKDNKSGKGVPIIDEGTDSESFFRYLNDHTIEETIAKLKDYSDAYAFVWFDKVARTLNFLRNDRRPLWVASIGRTTIYWASEKGFLEFVLNRGYSGGVTNYIDKLQEIPVDTLVSFDITASNPVTACKVRKIDKPKREYSYGNDQGYYGQRRNHYNEYYNEWDGYEGADWSNVEAATEVPAKEPVTNTTFGQGSVKPSIEERKTIWEDIKENIKNRENEDKKTLFNSNNSKVFHILDKELNRDAYERMLQKGCAFCTTQGGIDENVFWMSHDSYLCENCKLEPELQDYIKAAK